MNESLVFDWLMIQLEATGSEVTGRMGLSDEIRAKLESLLNRELTETETEGLFESIRSDGDALAYLANLLRREKDGEDGGET